MSLPPQYFGLPGEEQHNYLRDVCIEFKKVVQKSKNIEELQYEMERFISAAKQVTWPHEKKDVFRKDEGEKSVQKVWKEFKRYVSNIDTESPQYLLDAIAYVETLLDQLKVR